eukprot:363628-Chlamydomonas_euryale.AAC.1
MPPGGMEVVVSLWFPNRPQSSPLARQSLSSLQGGGGGGGLVAHQQPSNKQRPRAMPMPVPTPHAVAQSSRRHTPWHRAPGVTRRGTELQASHAVAQSSRRHTPWHRAPDAVSAGGFASAVGSGFVAAVRSGTATKNVFFRSQRGCCSCGSARWMGGCADATAVADAAVASTLGSAAVATGTVAEGRLLRQLPPLQGCCEPGSCCGLCTRLAAAAVAQTSSRSIVSAKH